MSGKIDGVPRELLEDLRDSASEEAEQYRQGMGSIRPHRQASLDKVVADCDALLAAPVVERQPVAMYPRCTILKECSVRSSASTDCKASPPAPVAGVLDERAEFVKWVRREWPQAPLSNVRDLLPADDPRYGEYCDETLQRAWVGWQARACLDKVKEPNQ